MGCATATLKYTHITVNIIFAIISLILIVGLFVYPTSDTTSTDTPLIIICSLLFLISIATSCGALRESIWLTWMCTAFSCIVAFCLVYMIFVETMPVKTTEAAHAIIDLLWIFVLAGNANEMNRIQERLSCCGLNGAQDYKSVNIAIPQSCYHNESGRNNILNQDGCYKALDDDFTQRKNIFYWIHGGLLVYEIFAIALGIYLAIHFRNKQRRSTY